MWHRTASAGPLWDGNQVRLNWKFSQGMPKHYEFVVAAYAVWIVVFAIYFVVLLRKSGRVMRNLQQLDRKGAAPDGERR